jgi:galactitol-specific phosphotransferase system IIC component
MSATEIPSASYLNYVIPIMCLPQLLRNIQLCKDIDFDQERLQHRSEKKLIQVK